MTKGMLRGMCGTIGIGLMIGTISASAVAARIGGSKQKSISLPAHEGIELAAPRTPRPATPMNTRPPQTTQTPYAS